MLRCPARLFGAHAEASECWNHVSLFGLLCHCRRQLARLGGLTYRRRTCLHPRSTSLFALVAHERCTECALRGELVMGSAPKPDPLHRRLTPKRHRVDVIELQEAARRASPAGRADKRAATPVSLPHGTPHVSRDVTLARGSPRGRTRPVRRCELA